MLTQKKRQQRRPTWLIVLLILGGAALFHEAYQANTRLEPQLPTLAAQDTMSRWFEAPPETLLKKIPVAHYDTLAKIYRNNHHRMLWLEGYGLSANGELLLQQLLESSADELFDYQYHLAYIQQRLHNLPTRPREVTALDILMTDAFVAYILDIINGKMKISAHGTPSQSSPIRTKPVAFNRDTTPLPTRARYSEQHRDIVALLKNNRAPQQLARVLQGLTPQHQEYLRLRRAFNFYQQLVSDNQWQHLEHAPSVELGDRDPQVIKLRHQLTLSGDYRPERPERNHYPQPRRLESPFPAARHESEDLFDHQLDLALKRFQARHGLEVDGVMGRQTRALLNITPNFRVRQIALNMKRWRELPRDLGERYIWVNMTDYTLQLINQGDVELDMRVIIGKEYRKTPVMSEKIHSLVLNPHWNVPYRIAVNDLLPQIKSDPAYLERRRFLVFRNWQDLTPLNPNDIDWNNLSRRNFPYRLQQKPGRGNALGRIKFVIPNDQSIYLHDTSSRDLFDRSKRTLSSGCVRVEKPLELAAALMKGDADWDSERLSKTIRGQNTRYVKLPKPIPTYLFYQTAWVDDADVLHFRNDIYQGDQVVHHRLSQPVSL